MTTDPQPSAQLDREGVAHYGFLRLQRYAPASRDGYLAEHAITHDIAGDANLDAVLRAVADFLRAAGYSVGRIVEEGG